LGRKSTTYSAPRYSSVWPFWRPKPLTSVTVMPCTPISDSASRTSSSLKGLMMAALHQFHDVQAKVLARTRAKLETLEQQVAELEARLLKPAENWDDPNSDGD
jgi:hypothetical protein